MTTLCYFEIKQNRRKDKQSNMHEFCILYSRVLMDTIEIFHHKKSFDRYLLEMVRLIKDPSTDYYSKLFEFKSVDRC